MALAPGLGERLRHGECPVEHPHRFLERVTPAGSLPEASQVGDGLVGHPCLCVVMGELVRDLLQAVGVEALEGGADGGVQGLAPGRQQALVGHVPDPIVGECEMLAGHVEHAPPHQLLHAGRGLVRVEPGRPLGQREAELPSHHRRHRGEPMRAVAEPLEAGADDLPDPLRERHRWRSGRGIGERAHALDHDEGIALAEGPHLVGGAGEPLLVAARAGEGADEGGGLVPREGGQLERQEIRLGRQLFHQPAEGGSADQLFLSRGGGH